MSCWR